MATSAFGRAFREARANGDSTFEWNGKTYTTKLKEEVAASTPARAPAPDPRDLEATRSRGRPPEGIDQIPGQSTTEEQRRGIAGGERVTGTEFGRNVSNTLNALTPLGGGALKVGTELAMGNRGAQAASKLSPAGQRLADLEELRNVAYPGRAEAVMNPSAWAGGPRSMEKIAEVEGRAAAKEAAAARAQAAKDAKDPVMNARPGEKPGYNYEGDAALPPSSGYKRGGNVKRMAKGGLTSKPVKSSASSRGDGIASRGKTRGKIC